MTPEQRRLARSALGLPNKHNRSYRNHFLAAMCPGDYDQWCQMTDAGMADCGIPVRAERSRLRMVHFWLTRAGAEAALDPGETLCTEDFPPPLNLGPPEAGA